VSEAKGIGCDLMPFLAVGRHFFLVKTVPGSHERQIMD
jgi:hypothetical protein